MTIGDILRAIYSAASGAIQVKNVANSGVDMGDVDVPAIGTTADAAASSTVAESTTARTGIGLWKGIKNILILLNTAMGEVQASPTANTLLARIKALETALAGTLTATVSSVTIPTAIYHGQKTVTSAGTEEALAASQAILSGVRIKALAGNTNNVYVGANPVTSSTGFVLDAGEEVFIEVANLATVFIDVDTNGEGVSYIAS